VNDILRGIEMKRKVLFAGGAVMLLLVVLLTGCGAGSTVPGQLPSDLQVNMNSQQHGIWVSGEGKVTVVPDVANLRLGVSAQESTVSAAQTKASDAMNGVMDALKSAGVAQKDIKTQYFNIQKVTRWDRDREQEVVLGYRVSNTVTAKIRKIESAGEVIDAVAKVAGDLTRIDGISFSIDDPTDYRNEAREKAMADAKAKAEQMAKLSGVKVGSPTYITESFYAPPPIVPREMAKADVISAASPPTPISVGEMDITVNVQVVYSIR